jgi:hypothetical protein
LAPADFPDVSKLEKSIVIDSFGGKTGGSPLSFLQATKKPEKRIRNNPNDTSFFIMLTINFENNDRID